MSVTDELKLKSKIERWLLREDSGSSDSLSPKMRTIIKYARDISNERISVALAVVAAACLDEDIELAAKAVMGDDGRPRCGVVVGNTNSHNYDIDSMVVRIREDHFLRPDGSQGNHLRDTDLRDVTKEEVETFLETASSEWLAAVKKLAK